jgi:hypothetical protein
MQLGLKILTLSDRVRSDDMWFYFLSGPHAALPIVSKIIKSAFRWADEISKAVSQKTLTKVDLDWIEVEADLTIRCVYAIQKDHSFRRELENVRALIRAHLDRIEEAEYVLRWFDQSDPRRLSLERELQAAKQWQLVPIIELSRLWRFWNFDSNVRRVLAKNFAPPSYLLRYLLESNREQ